MFFKKILKILIALFIIVTVVALWFFFGVDNEEKLPENNDSSTSIFEEEKSDKANSTPKASIVSTQTKKYENVRYGLSFNYPDGFTLSEFDEEIGKTVLTMQNKKTSQSLQIYITAYEDQSFVVDKERILIDVPDMPFLNSVDVSVDGKAKGVAFFSQNDSFGDTAEVWFADGKNFYQTTAYKEDVKVLEEIIKSWRFK